MSPADAIAESVLEVTKPTSRLNTLPFDDETGKAALFELILGRPLPASVTIYPQAPVVKTKGPAARDLR